MFSALAERSVKRAGALISPRAAAIFAYCVIFLTPTIVALSLKHMNWGKPIYLFKQGKLPLQAFSSGGKTVSSGRFCPGQTLRLTGYRLDDKIHHRPHMTQLRHIRPGQQPKFQIADQ